MPGSSVPSAHRVLNSNSFLTDRGIPLPKATSTGTTIVGCLFKDGIVLGADTRATEGPIVADKNCEKVRLLYSFYSAMLLIARAPDPLHHRVNPLLRCRDGRGHRIHNRTHLVEHGVACPLDRPEAACGHRDDYAQTNALPVRIRIS